MTRDIEDIDLNDDEYLTTGEVGKILRVDGRTIRDWMNDGHIKGERTRGGHARIPTAEVRRVLKEWTQPRRLTPKK